MGTRADSILKALREGDFLLSVHAATRMQKRSITSADIQACGRTAKTCRMQPERRTWRIEGKDLDGEALTVICAADDGVFIVTLF